MLWRKPYSTVVLRGVVAASGWDLVIGVPSWEEISQAELWLRLADRDLAGVSRRVLLYMVPDETVLEACVAPSRLVDYGWSSSEWPIDVDHVFASVPVANLTVVGQPTEDVWDEVVNSIAKCQH